MNLASEPHSVNVIECIQDFSRTASGQIFLKTSCHPWEYYWPSDTLTNLMIIGGMVLWLLGLIVCVWENRKILYG